MDGNYLVILVSVIIILPLALMRQLGETAGSHFRGTPRDTGEAGVSQFPSFAGYLGYSSGFSLSCMVFFLIAVSHPPCWSERSVAQGSPLSEGGGQGLLGSWSEKTALLILNMVSQSRCWQLCLTLPLSRFSTPGHLQEVPSALPTGTQLGQCHR